MASSLANMKADTLEANTAEANATEFNPSQTASINLPSRPATKQVPTFASVRPGDHMPGRYPHPLPTNRRPTPYQIPSHIASQLATLDETNPYVAAEMQHNHELYSNRMVSARREMWMLLVMSTCKRNMGAKEWAEPLEDDYPLEECGRAENHAPHGDRERVLACLNGGVLLDRSGEAEAEAGGDGEEEYDAWDEDDGQWLGMLLKHKRPYRLSREQLLGPET